MKLVENESHAHPNSSSFSLPVFHGSHPERLRSSSDSKNAGYGKQVDMFGASERAQQLQQLMELVWAPMAP